MVRRQNKSNSSYSGTYNYLNNDYLKITFRSLAVAKTNEEGQWEMLGMLTFLDPPRPDTKQTIEDANKYGVAVKMITGKYGPFKSILSSIHCYTHRNLHTFTYPSQNCHSNSHSHSLSPSHSLTMSPMSHNAQAIICSSPRRRPKFSHSARTLSRPKDSPCSTRSPSLSRIIYPVTTGTCVLRLMALLR